MELRFPDYSTTSTHSNIHFKISSHEMETVCKLYGWKALNIDKCSFFFSAYTVQYILPGSKVSFNFFRGHAKGLQGPKKYGLK
jgi:hypothetical protein